MTSAYKLVFGILGEHYLTNSLSFLRGEGSCVVLDDVTSAGCLQIASCLSVLFPN